jgi:hypothetical protein
LHVEVRRIKQQHAVTRAPVAPAAPGFLDVLLERRRHLVMEHVADVRLVNAHTERARRNHHLALLRPHVALLRGLAIGLAHLAMVAIGRNARALERAVDAVDLDGRRAVHDPGALQAAQQPTGRHELGAALHDLRCEAQVLAVRRRNDERGIAHR